MQRLPAVIPARGGSKGIPGKNVRNLGGMPLIAFSIKAALEAGDALSVVAVSTDDREIMETARKWAGVLTSELEDRYQAEGRERPIPEFVFIDRPSELARDDTPGIDPVRHAVTHLEDECGYEPAAGVVLLQPTSPLRQARHIVEAVEMFHAKDADWVVGMTEVEHSPFWYFTERGDGRFEPLLKDEGGSALATPRQQLGKVYRINGAVYVYHRERMLFRRSESGELLAPSATSRTYGYIMDRVHSVDVDEPIDLLFVQTILDNLGSSGGSGP